MRLSTRTPWPIGAWIVFCAFCNAAGWLLSAFHQLNRGGYAVMFLLGLAALVILRRKLVPSAVAADVRRRIPGDNQSLVRLLTSAATSLPARLRKQRWRFSRLFPLAFLLLSGLAILGGIIHAPNNYDALAHRTPRVLHWLAEGRWHWIHTEFERLNTRGCGSEWVTAPLIAFTGTDRLVFLINVVSILLLPGCVFGLLTRLGVSGRVAWHWMWLLPSGYCYLLQAGSIGNDLFGAVLALLAIELALRARQSRTLGPLWLSILAAGLMTAGKGFNLLLVLPWAAAAWPAFRLLLRQPLVSVLDLLFSASASLLPTAWLNLRQCGDWTGISVEHMTNLAQHTPVLHFVVNALLLVLHNFVPTIFPFANHWNHLMDRVIPPHLAGVLAANFEPSGARFVLKEMDMEEGAGLGFGLSVLLLIVLIHRIISSSRGQWTLVPRQLFCYQLLVPVLAWAGTAVFMAKSGLSCPARYLAPFYPLLVAPLLADKASSRLVRSRWWPTAGLGVFFLAGLLLVVCPSRPLWPALPLLRALDAERSCHPLLRRAWTVYSVYGQRSDAFAPARALLPADSNPLGMITGDDPEASLWRPFGSRRILHVCHNDSPQELRNKGIKYVLANSVMLSHFGLSLEDWLAQNNAQLLRRMSLELRAGMGPAEWFLIELR